MDRRTEKVIGKNKVAERTWKDKDTVIKPRYRRTRANRVSRAIGRMEAKHESKE